MPDFIIETQIPPKIRRSGRKPTSEEYEIGTKIYNEFEVGNCSFFPSTLKYKSLLSRLKRLNEKNNTDYEFTVRKDSITGKVIIDGVYEPEVIEGFKIYRTK